MRPDIYLKGIGIRWAWTIWLLTPILAVGGEHSVFFVQWHTNSTHVTVEVLGIDEKLLQKVEDWNKLLAVYADSPNVRANSNLPPMLGTYRVEDGKVQFQPTFPLQPGVIYRAVFRPAALPGAADTRVPEVVKTLRLPSLPHKSATVVTQIYPTANVLPANLLKFYVYFSSPMSRGHIYDHIKLIDDSDKPVELPFLELDQEL